MTDHKFEPFQKVLVRDHVQQKWKAHFFSHMDGNYFVTGDSLWQYCIPYTTVTAHLLGTSQPYEPPKPPQEYEWGQKVEVNQGDSKWKIAIYIGPARDPDEHWCTKKESPHALSALKIANIRPIHDDTAAH